MAADRLIAGRCRHSKHYAIDRLAAFSNITWDLGDDLDQYRDDRWTHQTGGLIKQWDPYRHLATSHPGEGLWYLLAAHQHPS